MEKPRPDRSLVRSPRHVDIEITSDCNLRCRYCYYFNDTNHASVDLPTSEWLKFFKELGEIQVMDLTLAGGEPFIRKDLKEILDGIGENRMRYTLLSNGGLITRDIARFMAASNRCDGVQISLDGASAETHDINRGKGSFDAAVRGIRLLQEAGIFVELRLTLHHHNVHTIREATSFILDTIGLPGFSVNCAGYMGTCKSYADDVLLTVEDREVAMKTLLEVAEKYPGRVRATAGPLAEVRYWREMIKAADEKRPGTAGTLSACGCFFQKLAVQSDGTIVPCNLLPNVKLGRINTDNFLDVWQHSPVLQKMRRRHEIPLSRFEQCKDCRFQPYCTGNCPGLAVSMTGNVNHPAPDACLRLFLESGGTVP